MRESVPKDERDRRVKSEGDVGPSLGARKKEKKKKRVASKTHAGPTVSRVPSLGGEPIGRWRVVASRARRARARASRTIVASAYLSCSPMRFQSASSWSFSYEVCRRPRANAPRVPRRRSDFPPASCGASARTSARREAHRRVASPPAPMTIPERSPAVPEVRSRCHRRLAAACGTVSRGTAGQRYSRAVVTISYRLAHSTVSDSRFAPIAKQEFAREFLLRQQRRSSGRANQRSRRGAGRATGSRRGAFPRRG